MIALACVHFFIGASTASGSDHQRFRVFTHGRWFEYFERDDLAIAEGDIVLGKAKDIAEMRDRTHPLSAKALVTNRNDLLWPIGPSGVHEVPYVVETGVNSAQAVAIFNNTLGDAIKWVPRTTQADYVAFNLANTNNNTSGSCFATFGRVGGRQEIGGNSNCVVWQLLHEMGHAIGMHHTHQAPTAYQFIQVDRASEDPVRRQYFDPVYQGNQLDGFDYMSIMAYGPFDASVTPDDYISHTLPAGMDLGNVTGYSAGDIDSIKRLYGVTASTVMVTTNPPGLDVVIDGIRVATPSTLPWGLGSAHQLDVPGGLQTKAGYSFAFGRWSHDGSANPTSAQRWVVQPGQGAAGQNLATPKVGVLIANFIRLIDIRRYSEGDTLGQFTMNPEVPAWAGTQTLYPQLTKIAMAATPNLGSLNFWHWQAATSITGGYGGSADATLRLKGDLPTQQVGGGFFAGPGIVVQTAGPGVDGSLDARVQGPNSLTDFVTLPWAFKRAAGAYKVLVDPTIPRSDSVRFALKGIANLDSPAEGTVTMPGPGQSTKIVTVNLQKEVLPVVQAIPDCGGSVNFANRGLWLPAGTTFTATATPVSGAVFTGWTGTAAGTAGSINVTANAVPELIAHFSSAAETFDLRSIAPNSYDIGQGSATLQITGTGFTPDTYVILNNAVVRTPQVIDPHTLRVTISDADVPIPGALQISLGHHVAGECYGFSDALPVSIAYAAPADLVAAYEFYNASLDHYFITWAPDELTKLDAGTVIKGWARTGKNFRVFTAAHPGTSPVCRFYIPPLLSDSHFFGRGTAECNATASKNPTFVLEDAAFMQMYLPNAGNCPAATTPIYRVFSNRPDANHRYTADRSVRDAMVAKGWVAEGDGPDRIVMCAPQ